MKFKEYLKTQFKNYDKTVAAKKYITNTKLNESLESFKNTLIKDSSVYCPDDYGAVGNGEIDDSEAFLDGDYIYHLTDGKTYRISAEKLTKIYNNEVEGNGTVRFYETNIWENKAYGKNTDIIPTYGKNVFEISSPKFKNRLEECVSYYSTADTVETTGTIDKLSDNGSRPYKRQGIKPPSAVDGKYRNVCSIYYDRREIDTLPNEITICIGKNAVLHRRTSDGKWIKTIDGLINTSNIKNVGIPWSYNNVAFKTGEYEVSRNLTNAPVVVGDHIEITIDKQELITWSTSSGSSTDNINEGCVHLYSDWFSYKTDSFDDAVNYWEVWTTTPAAQNHLVVSVGMDNTNTGSKNWFSKMIFSAPMPITTEIQQFWGCTMSIDKVKNIDFNKMYNLLNDNISNNYSLQKSVNILNVAPFEATVGAFTLKHLEDDTYEISAVDSESSFGNKEFHLKQYITNLDISKGDNYIVYFEVLDEDVSAYTYQMDFKLGSYNVTNQGNHTQIGKTIYKKNVCTENIDDIVFKIWAGSKTGHYDFKYTKFRIWITRGDELKSYQSPTELSDVPSIKEDVYIPRLENKISQIENRISENESSNISFTDIDIDFTKFKSTTMWN